MFINAKIYLVDFYSISFLQMKSLQKFICFFLALQLFSLAQSTHHEHNVEALKKANTPLSLEDF